jgi:hypothetical protein
MPRYEAPASLSPAVQGGNPESGVATNKERHFATPTSWRVGQRRTWTYAAITEDEGNEADGRFSAA